MARLLPIAQVMDEIRRLAARIDVPEPMLPTACVTPWDSHPSIEVHSSGYHYVIVERGEEIERFITADLDTLLFRVFLSITSKLAWSYELKRRVPGRDPQRLVWQHQEELMAVLSPEWGARVSQDHHDRAAQHPFRDEEFLTPQPDQPAG